MHIIRIDGRLPAFKLDAAEIAKIEDQYASDLVVQSLVHDLQVAHARLEDISEVFGDTRGKP